MSKSPSMHYASFIRSHKDSGLWVVVCLPVPARGSLLDSLTTRMSFVSDEGPQEGDVFRMYENKLTKCGSLYALV